MALAPGSRVASQKYGTGTVVRATRIGAMVALDRLAGLQVEIRAAELVAHAPDADSPSPASDVETHVVPPKRLSAARFGARCSIEALRFGIVPVRSLAELTLGYEKLQWWALRQLPDAREGRPCVAEVCGPFGTGKSHTMAAIRHMVSARGYLTASVEVDGSNVSLSDPAVVLKQLWSTLQGADLESTTPLVDLNIRAIERDRAAAERTLSPFERVKTNLQTVAAMKLAKCIDKHGEHFENLLACGDDVTASGLKQEMQADFTKAGISRWDTVIDPKRLIGLAVDSRAFDFVECLLGYATLAKLAGFRGLVITIDEFEVESHLSAQKHERLQDVLDALIYRLGTEGAGPAAPLTMFIATVGQGGASGDETVEALVEGTGGERFPLRNWPSDAQLLLAQKIHRLYCEAYDESNTFDVDLARSTQRALDDADIGASGQIRAFIKRYVAELDATYGPRAA